MLNKRSIKVVKSFFSGKLKQEPDFIYPGMIFDPLWREEKNLKTPLISKVKPLYDTPGSYAFFEPCNQNNEIEVIYVGRSKTLRNRLSQHWRSGTGQTEPLVKWFDYCWDNDYPFCPHVAIFVCYQDIVKLERYLMHFLSPRFNVH